MRLLLQRVTRAEVRRADAADAAEPVGRIERGLLVLVGVAPDDGTDEIAWAAGKLLDLRIFPDATGKMNLDVVAAGGSLLVVSQFTLYADTHRGRRPGFTAAATPDVAERIYLELVERLRQADVPVATGSFGRAMHVELVGDGPVTLWLDSADR